MLAAWVADHKVEINPKYSVDLGSKDGTVDTNVSYALGRPPRATPRAPTAEVRRRAVRGAPLRLR